MDTRQRLRAFLLTAPAGVLLAHACADLVIGGRTPAHEAAHAHLIYSQPIAVALAVVGLALGARRGYRIDRQILTRLAVIQAALFVGLELGEALVSGAGPLALAAAPVLLGVLVQPLTAALLALAADGVRRLGGVALVVAAPSDAAGARLDRRGAAVSTAASTWPSTQGRAPPVGFSTR